MAKIVVCPLHPSIFNFQSCILSESLTKELDESFSSPTQFETFLAIHIPSRNIKVLNRWCRNGTLDGGGVIQSDFRVEELLEQQQLETNFKEKNQKFASTQECNDGKSSCKDFELGRHLRAKERRGKKTKMNGNSESNSGFDVDEEEEEEMESSVRFNDALYCTSKDIQMLKSGTIKKMRLTVISDAPLSDFLYETNQHKMTTEEDSKTKKSKLSSFYDQQKQQEKTTAKEDEGELEVVAVDSTFTLKTFSWKSLREKIRQIFTSYEIHVRRNALVDLRECPLATKKGWPGCPSISFVFVEECIFRGGGSGTSGVESGNTTTESDIGKVSSKTEILINHVHHISHYKRQLLATTVSNNLFKHIEESQEEEEKVTFGYENAGKMLRSLIEMQQEQKKVVETGIVESDDGKCLLMNNFYSHGLLIAGPNGCGKSLVVRETVKKLRANLLVYKSLTGQTDVEGVGNGWTQIFNDALLSSVVCPTVLLIPRVEECLLINKQQQQQINQGGKRNSANKLLNHVCNLFDSIPPNAKLTVVATTNKPFLLPAKLRRAGRLEREVYIGAPTEKERLNILKSLSKKVPSLSKLDLDSVAQRTPGYVGQDLIRLSHLAILKSYEEHCTKVAESHIKYALSRILPSVLQGTLGVVGIHRTTSLDHIAGLHSVKHDLIKAIVWPLKFPHAFQTMGITPPKGILLHSPPGCAKTTLVRAVAASHQTNFLSVSAAELFSSGVGDSEKIVADLFHRARMASPCILFIDELEAIVGSRQMSQKKEKTSNESILSMLLTEMDGIGTLSQCATDRASSQQTDDPKSFGPLVLVVAATNRIDMIDSALIRPGRFDKLIYVPPLDRDGRLELLRICAQTTPFSLEVNFEEIAENTGNFSGADIVNLCREAALLALCDDMKSCSVSKENVFQAMSKLSPSLSSQHHDLVPNI